MQPQRNVVWPVQTAAKQSIHSAVLDEIETYLMTLNERPYRAKQIVDWLYQKRAGSFEEMSDLPQALRARLAQDFCFGNLETVRVVGSAYTTRKFLFSLRERNAIESMLIPGLAVLD